MFSLGERDGGYLNFIASLMLVESEPEILCENTHLIIGGLGKLFPLPMAGVYILELASPSPLPTDVVGRK